MATDVGIHLPCMVAPHAKIQNSISIPTLFDLNLRASPKKDKNTLKSYLMVLHTMDLRVDNMAS